MSSATESLVGIVAYLAMFIAVGFGFLLVSLLVGKLIRPANPHAAKREIYECGEPAIGTSFVQFDLRFYVVALLFIIFDVEVAFFFPWAVVFGKATNMSKLAEVSAVASDTSGELALTEEAKQLYQELGVRNPQASSEIPSSLRAEFDREFPASAAPAGSDVEDKARATFVAGRGARQLALITVVDIVVFFAVLVVGFAYVWKRGDLDWVRAVSPRDTQAASPSSDASQRETALSA
jgi:NADH-quinone oxidoreductase subunit A